MNKRKKGRKKEVLKEKKEKKGKGSDRRL